MTRYLILATLCWLWHPGSAHAGRFGNGCNNGCYDPCYYALPYATPVAVPYFVGYLTGGQYVQPTPYYEPPAPQQPVAAAAPADPAPAPPCAPHVTVNLNSDEVADKLAAKLVPAIVQAIREGNGQVAPVPVPPQPVAPAQMLAAPVGVSVNNSCVKCHGGANAGAAAVLRFADPHTLNCQQSMHAIKDIRSGKMPKGRVLSALEKEALIAEILAAQP